MNSIRKWIRNIFGFSGTEINGFLILLPVTVVIIFSEPIYFSWVSRPNTYPGEVKQLDSIVSLWAAEEKASHSGKPLVSFFSFDPNTVSISDLRRLGFHEQPANRIAAYRSKGGVFRIKSDLLKIYGLDSTLYKQLYPYISLPSSRTLLTESGYPRSHPKKEAFEKTQQRKTFDINTADTTLLKTVYGIGPRLAARIVKFREGLGGFIDKVQLYEVYGLDSVVVERLLTVSFIEPNFVPERIDLNASNEEQMARHPYIRYKLARILVSYRYQHGDFHDVSDIKNLSVISTKDMERLLPYLKVNINETGGFQ